MDVRILPGRLKGAIAAMPSKSDAHRALIAAAFADGPTLIRLDRTSIDIEATAHCLSVLGTKIALGKEGYRVTPAAQAAKNPFLDCKESGSTLRFLLPVAKAVCETARFTGSGRLPSRPIGPLKAAMEAHGVRFDSERLPLTASGAMSGGVFSIPGNISSQYITGLLLALPLLPGGGSVALTTPLESAGYVDITAAVMARFGVTVEKTRQGYGVSGRYRSSGEYQVEGDWSNAAFFLAANVLGSKVQLTGLNPASPQGDAAVASLLPALGGGKEVDLRNIPDALPAMAVAAAFSPGETRFVNGARLRLKDSDRLATVARMLKALGGSAEELPEGLIVLGTGLFGGTVDCANDHRIAMAAAVAATACKNPVTLLGAQAVEKSYPAFFEDFIALGGNCHVI